MRRYSLKIIICLLVVLLVFQGIAAAFGDDEEQQVVTKHQIICDGQPLKYTAKAGYLPIRDQFGETKAKFFYVAYSLDSDKEKRLRPVTFIWNGGPGAPSSPLHFSFAGPRLRADKGELDISAYSVIDNNETLLKVSDLVMVDPIGTGYSYPLKPEYGNLFWGVQQDIDSITEFIRLYLTHNDCLQAPIFLIGESYGTFRAAAVAENLAKKDYDLRGIVFISSVLNMQIDKLISMALSVPSWTAASFFHKKLPSDLQTDLNYTLHLAEDWATGEYLRVLLKGSRVEDQERRTAINNLARFTGLSPDFVEKNNLRVSLDQYSSQIFAPEKKFISHYDARLLGIGNGSSYDPTRDPALFSRSGNPFLFILYLRKELGFKSDRPYQGPFGGFWPPSKTAREDWMAYRWDWGSLLDSKLDQGVALANALKMKDNLQVLFVSGLYDLTTPYFLTEYTIRQLDLGQKIGMRIDHKCYPGGHMMYEDEKVRIQLAKDILSFYSRVMGKILNK